MISHTLTQLIKKEIILFFLDSQHLHTQKCTVPVFYYVTLEKNLTKSRLELEDLSCNHQSISHY